MKINLRGGRTIHTEMGIGYAECEDCYYKSMELEKSLRKVGN